MRFKVGACSFLRGYRVSCMLHLDPLTPPSWTLDPVSTSNQANPSQLKARHTKPYLPSPSSCFAIVIFSLHLWLSLYDEPSIAPASSDTDAAGGAGATDRLSSSSEDGNTRTLPASMVLHASALLRSTFSTRATSPVCHLRVQDTAR